jgi:hypothetical protein
MCFRKGAASNFLASVYTCPQCCIPSGNIPLLQNWHASQTLGKIAKLAQLHFNSIGNSNFNLRMQIITTKQFNITASLFCSAQLKVDGG